MAIFEGSGAALITPFDENGVNYDAFGKLIDYQLKNGSGALFVLGTTGEPATMSRSERDGAVSFAVERAARRVPVIVGSGCNCTAEAVQSSLRAQELGADGLLVVTPYYNKCTQNGLYEHYRAVCDAVDIPVIAYNVPTRTNVNINPDTAARLSTLKNMTGLKEASGDIDQLQAVAAAIENKMDLYIGDDSLTAVAYCLGAKGVISVAANVVPKVMATLTNLCAKGNFAAARALQFELIPLMSALFCEVNPIPVKKAMSLIGLDCGVPRLPLTEAMPAHTELIAEALEKISPERRGIKTW